jgi:hypothetical protein
MKLQQHQQKHIEAWQSSGMSQAAYCREQRLNAKTFGNYWWLGRWICAAAFAVFGLGICESPRVYRRLYFLRG